MREDKREAGRFILVWCKKMKRASLWLADFFCLELTEPFKAATKFLPKSESV
ncbi:MAG: hypothetical protein NZ937_09490 [Armatimonadetes bacterium]|nr:hypothetical protein [Armatimonadota bacterium]